MPAIAPRPADDTTTFTSSAAMVVSVLLDALELGRHLELSPDRRAEAHVAFGIASRLRGVLRQEAVR